MKTLNEYVITKDTLVDMHTELKQRRCKATAKLLTNVLEQWMQIERDLDLRERLAREKKVSA